MEIFNFPEHPSDAEGVRRILTQDMVYRNRQQWSLVKFEDFKNFQTDYSKQKDYPNKTSLLFVTNNGDFQWDCIEEKIQYRKLEDTNSIFEKIKQISIINDLLAKYYGKISICGDYIARVLVQYNNYRSRNSESYANNEERLSLFGYYGKERINYNNIDIYLYGITESNGEIILKDCIVNIIAKGKNDTLISEIKVERTLHTTKVVLFNHESKIAYGYRFIHQIYPRLDLIIGSFDFSPYMVAYTGKEIFASPLAAWSIMKRTIIFDSTKKGSMYENNVEHNNKSISFRVVFPGIYYINETFNKLAYMNRIVTGERLMEIQENPNLIVYSKVYNGKFFIITRVKFPLIKFDYFTLYIIIYEEPQRKDEGFPETGYYIEQNTMHVLRDPNIDITQNVLDKHCGYISQRPYEDLGFYNAKMLRANNLDKVISCYLFAGDKHIISFVNHLFENSNITLSDAYNHNFKSVIDSFYDEENDIDPDYESEDDEYEDVEHNPMVVNLLNNTTNGIALFSDFLSIFRMLRKIPIDNKQLELRVQEVKLKLNSRECDNLVLAIEKFKGINWLRYSNRFDRIEPKNVYINNYNHFRVGLNNTIETLIRLIHKRNTNFKLLNKDVLNLILQKLTLNSKYVNYVPRRCRYCGEKATLSCIKCIDIFYCSQKCQYRDWVKHKLICKK